MPERWKKNLAQKPTSYSDVRERHPPPASRRDLDWREAGLGGLTLGGWSRCYTPEGSTPDEAPGTIRGFIQPQSVLPSEA